jgi:hypothetical protein
MLNHLLREGLGTVLAADMADRVLKDAGWDFDAERPRDRVELGAFIDGSLMRRLTGIVGVGAADEARRQIRTLLGTSSIPPPARPPAKESTQIRRPRPRRKTPSFQDMPTARIQIGEVVEGVRADAPTEPPGPAEGDDTSERPTLMPPGQAKHLLLFTPDRSFFQEVREAFSPDVEVKATVDADVFAALLLLLEPDNMVLVLDGRNPADLDELGVFDEETLAGRHVVYWGEGRQNGISPLLCHCAELVTCSSEAELSDVCGLTRAILHR